MLKEAFQMGGGKKNLKKNGVINQCLPLLSAETVKKIRIFSNIN